MSQAPRHEGIEVLERGWLSSNNVVLHGGAPEEGAVLVDTGYSTHAPQTLALVANALRPGESVRLVANTHLHSDHCGGNAAAAAEYGCPIVVPPGDFESVLAWDESRLTYRATGQHCDRFTPAGKLLPGEVIRQGGLDWEIHAAPGHDPHSVIMFEPASRTLISADALWERGFGIVFPELDGEHAFDEVAATLDLIETLRPRQIIPGHGAPFQDLPGALAVARSRLDYFRREPLRHAASAAKALTVFHLLEVRTQSHDRLLDWLTRTPILESTWARFFGDQPLTRWAAQMVQELIRTNVVLESNIGSVRTIHIAAS